MQESLRKDRQSHSSTDNWFERRQRSVITDSRGCSGPKGLVPSSFQHPGGSRSLQNASTPKGATSEHTGKPSRPKSEPHNKRRIDRRSSDTTRGGFRAARPAPKSEEKPKSAVTKICTFEVKLSDFPELCDTKPLASPDARTCWGSVKSAALHDSPATTVKETSGSNGPKQKSIHHITSTEKPHQKSTATADIELVLPNPYGSPAASWATVASQPPKVMQKAPAAQDVSSQEDVCQPEGNQTVKKRKKKKKSKPVCEGVEQEIHTRIQQEPPKFEYEEEFPDLSSASVIPSKGPKHSSNPGIQENVRIHENDGSVLQSEKINKSKAADGKSGSATSKKVQPVGQKKSTALVQLDLGNMLAVLEQKQQLQKSRQDVKPLTLSVGGAVPVAHKDPTAPKKHSWQQDRIAHNPLDSTCPLVKKGKQREVPKAKKPTPLKRVILKEREERKQNRLLEERDPTRMTSEVSQEPQASENLSESSSAQQCHEPTSDQSGAEEADRAGLPEGLPEDGKIFPEENALSKNWDSNSNPNHTKIHSRKFRDYCSQILSKDVDECVTTLLKELVRFQDRLYQKDPMKARMKRRLVMGLREVLKHLKLRKVKCVIISPNCERVQSKGGLDEALHTIIDTCREQGVPFVFALSRKSLGRCVNKAVPVSLVGIFNYDGAQDHYHKMIELTSQARKAYEVMIASLEVSSQEQSGEENETQQHMEPPVATPEAEEPEYIKVWKKMLENDYNHKFLPFEEQFTSLTISTDPDNHLHDLGGS